jgi:toxin ParE1/3/4
MNKVVVSPATRDDLDGIWDYIGIQNDAPDAARRLLERIQETFQRLASVPGMGTACDWLRPGLRRFPVRPYVIYYTPIPDGVEIERVIHGARDVDALFGVDEAE